MRTLKKSEKMKVRLTLATIMILALLSQAEAQNPDDALRYSQQFYSGTARFSAMGGAFTALGGDLSAIGLNPAATGVFRRSEFSFTPHSGYTNTLTRFTSTSDDIRYNFSIGQFGFIMPITEKGSESGLVSANFGYSYNQNNNFNTNTVIRGVNSTSSMADYWASSSNGTLYTNLSGSQALAYDAWLIDTITGTGAMQYGTVFSRYGDQASTYGQDVRRVISNEGSSGEHSFSLGANFNNNLFVGATLGISRFNYTGHYEHLETDRQNTIFDFNSFSYVDHFEAAGTGFNLKAGLIYIPVDFLRLGAAIHSPTIYKVREYYYDNLTSTFDDGSRYEFSSDAFRFNYRLTTPFRAMAGAAVQIQKFALLSFDYEYLDYSITRFSNASDGYDYYNENQSIKDIYKSAHNFRAGAEYRLGSLYLRGGYGYYGKAFNAAEANSDKFHSVISAGLGIRQSNFFFDMGFSKLQSSEKYFMYNHENVDPVIIETARINIQATIGFRF
jgi:hypothetical protein